MKLNVAFFVHSSFFYHQRFNASNVSVYCPLIVPAPCISESCTKIRINLKFSHYFVVPQRISYEVHKVSRVLWSPLKSGSHPLEKAVLFASMKALQTWLKMLFISSLKALFILKIFKFVWTFWKNGLIKNRFSSKFMASQPG